MSEYFVESTTQFNELAKKENDTIKYKCSQCGSDSKFLYKKSRQERQSLLLCSQCSMKHTNLQKYGVEASSQNQSVKEKISKSCTKIECPDELSVSTPEEFDTVVKKTGIKIKYKCLSCGKDSSVAYYAYKAVDQRKLLCTQCLRKSEKESVFVNSTEEFDNLEKKDGMKISFSCSVCGTNSVLSYKGCRDTQYRKLICSSCQRKITSKERYGVESSSQLPETKEKMRKTNESRYGNNHPIHSESSLSKIKKTNLKKYGVEYPLQSKDIQDKIKSNVFDKYGVDNVFKSAEIRDKIKATTRKKYGYDCIFYSPEYQSKIRDTFIRKYGTPYPHFPRNYIYDGEVFDSSWELALWIYAKDHNEDIVHEPTSYVYQYAGKEHLYFPDFRYKGELVEIKGGQFFNENGDMRNPFNPDEDGLYEAKRQFCLTNNIRILREADVKFALDYVNKKYTKNYLNLFYVGLDFPYMNVELIDKTDMGLIHHFHKSIYSASRKGKPSPLEAWNDKQLVKKSALNRLKYVGRCYPNDIIQGFSVAKIAPKISVFKPALATGLINTYLSDIHTIFDPFSGFSGRLLGASASNKCYIGQDINVDHVRESNEIIQYKQLDPEKYVVKEQDILTDTEKSYDALFTCPPYGGKEHWNENNDEIEKSCDEWIDICLSKYHCKKYLFVVDTTDKYKDNIVQTITNKSHFGSNNEYVILIER